MSYYNQKNQFYAQNLIGDFDFIAPVAEQNKIYKNQLINNYLKLTRNENDKSNNIKN